MTFAYYLAHQNFFDLLSMGAVQICASIALNGNLISEWLNRNANKAAVLLKIRKSNFVFIEG